jgi:hypothetical protein
MTRAVKTFTARIENKLGWDYPLAFVAIRHVEEESKTTYTSENCKDNYISGLNSHVIMYEANYWGSKEQQMRGLESCPLVHLKQFDEEAVYKLNLEGEYSLDDNGDKIATGEVIPAYEEWVGVFFVDVDHLQSKQVLNSSMSPEDKTFRLIELDVQRRFPA